MWEASYGLELVMESMRGCWKHCIAKWRETFITQAADTFVRDMVFTIEQITTDVWHLVGDQVFNEVRINLTLAPAP